MTSNAFPRRCWSAALVAAWLALAPGGVDAAEHVLPPSAATQVEAMLALDRPLADGTPVSAQIDRAQVVIRAGAKDAPRLHVRLVHPDVAPATAYRFGSVALVSDPGPATEADLAELRARIATGAATLGWELPASTPPPPPATHDQAEERALHAALGAAAEALGRQDRAGAVAALRKIAAPSLPEPRLGYAVALYKAGDNAGAVAALDGLPSDAPPDVLAVAAWMRGKATTLDAILAYWPQGRPGCDAAAAASSLLQVGQAELAAGLARQIRTLHSDCAEAWVEELGAHGELPPDPAFDADVEAAIAAFPTHAGVLEAAARLARRQRQWDRAIARYERVGALQPAVPHVLGHLSNAVLNAELDRSEAVRRYRERAEANPGDDVARFLAGVLLHYDDAYAESNAMLRPLIGRRDNEDRLWVYIAMNDFNLGKRDDALAALNRVAQGQVPDPDVFYCRAEILRDSDRAQAAADLRRYLAGSGKSDPSHAVKEARVRRLIAALEACQQTNPAVCEGEWEHPRKQRETTARNRLLAYGIGLALLLGLAWWTLRRRRRGA